MIKSLMSLPLWQIALVAVAALLASAAALTFVISVLREIATQAKLFATWLRGALGDAGVAATHCGIALARVVFKAVATGILWVAAPPCQRVARSLRVALAELNLAHAYVTKGRKSCASFSEFRASMAEDEEFKKFRANSATPDSDDLLAHDKALRVMGLTREEAKSMPKVKQRYRQIIALVHPDRGFPNDIFAQEVNRAMDVIRREHGLAD